MFTNIIVFNPQYINMVLIYFVLAEVKSLFHSGGGEVDFSLSPNSTYITVAISLTLNESDSRRKGRCSVLMSTSNSFSHLTLEERRIILTGITNGSTKTAIAQTIGKDKSTVGKEIKLHRALITVSYWSTPDRESILLPGKLRKH